MLRVRAWRLLAADLARDDQRARRLGSAGLLIFEHLAVSRGADGARLNALSCLSARWASSSLKSFAGASCPDRCPNGKPYGPGSARPYNSVVSTKDISDELVRQVADDLRARYELDDQDMRALGVRLAEAAGARSAENVEFAERFTNEHRETFDRLAK